MEETYVPIPDMNLEVAPAQTASPLQHSAKKETTPQASQSRTDAATARVHDITSDIEYGRLRYYRSKGGSIALKTQYTRFLDNYTRAGARIYFEHAFGDFNPSSQFGGAPGNNVTTILFAKRDVFLNQEAGVHLNYTLFFDAHTAPQHTFNPQAYYAYKQTIGPVFAFGGAFAGYSIMRKGLDPSQQETTEHTFAYSLIAGGGMAVGESFAANLDAFVSHHFLVLGTQVPVYVSEFFVLTPGIKWPILFNNPKYVHIKFSVGAHARL
jgi:hypothetical protein